MLRFLLAIICLSSTAWALDFSALEPIPVQEGGRKKPYLVFAQESLLGLTGRTSVKIDGRERPAMDIITSLWLTPQGWDEKEILLVNHKPLKEALGLDPERKLFSYRELAGNTRLASLLAEAQAQRNRPGAPRLAGLPKEAADVGLRLAEFETLFKGSAFRVVANPSSAESSWTTATPVQLAALRDAFVAGDQTAFDRAAGQLRESLAAIEPQFQPSPNLLRIETWYQKFHPFGWAWKFYLAAAVVLLLWNARGGYLAAWALAGVGLSLQIAGFAARTIISGRAPVTNMYESVIWVAFGTVLFALVFEAIYRSRFFLLGALPVAVISLILADTQPVALNPGIHPLVPVLRDNFWLSTHVTTITLSYAAFLLALGIGHIALGTVMAGKKPSPALYNYLYRVLQVGVLLLAIGTILGAIWANYSWGRFWDWDPKETWALVTLLAYLFLLHGRIAGKWGGFGMAVGAVLCFLSVLMAWYGVNFVLGAGLHSYGFGSGGFGYAIAFVVAELVFVALAVRRARRLAPHPQTQTAASGHPAEAAS
jgi:ABC-type transport system involved in cytochrome c biogenesis permease subunit